MLLLKSFASDRSVDSAPLRVPTFVHFHYASGFTTQILAHSLDSLVRVPRRVNENHFTSVANSATGWPAPVLALRTSRTLFSYALAPAGHGGRNPGCRFLCPGRASTAAYPKAPPQLSHPTRTDADPLHASTHRDRPETWRSTLQNEAPEPWPGSILKRRTHLLVSSASLLTISSPI